MIGVKRGDKLFISMINVELNEICEILDACWHLYQTIDVIIDIDLVRLDEFVDSGG